MADLARREAVRADLGDRRDLGSGAGDEHLRKARQLGGRLHLGIDIVQVSRIADSLQHFGDRFLARVFTPDEAAYAAAGGEALAPERLAARFAAKEAAMKALGTGHSHGVLWRDIEVIRRGGPPQLKFHGGAAKRFEFMKGRSSLLTITHSDALALAQVMLFSA